MARFERKAKPPHCSNAIGLRLGRERCRGKSEIAAKPRRGRFRLLWAKQKPPRYDWPKQLLLLPPRAWPPGKLDTITT